MDLDYLCRLLPLSDRDHIALSYAQRLRIVICRELRVFTRHGYRDGRFVIHYKRAPGAGKIVERDADAGGELLPSDGMEVRGRSIGRGDDDAIADELTIDASLIHAHHESEGVRQTLIAQHDVIRCRKFPSAIHGRIQLYALLDAILVRLELADDMVEDRVIALVADLAVADEQLGDAGIEAFGVEIGAIAAEGDDEVWLFGLIDETVG